MAVKNIVFDIPESMLEKIDSGEFIRFGGVIRNQAGQIVKHLDEVSIPIDKVPIPKNNKKGMGVAIVSLAAVAIAGIAYSVVKNKNEDKESKNMTEFNKSFVEYISSIKSSTVSEKKIDNVLEAIDKIKKNEKNGNRDFYFNNSKTLFETIRNYTYEFAKANSFEIPETECKQDIDGLKYYLQVQKQVFNKCK